MADTPDWGRPTGGLVMNLSDIPHCYAVAVERYHIGPHERLWIMEVERTHERAMAAMLHKRWEAEMLAWMEEVASG